MREKPHTSCGSALDINTWWSRQPMQAGLPIVTAWLGTDGSFTEEEVRPSPSEPGRLTNMHNGCTRSSLWRKYTVYTKILLFPVRLVRAISTHISPNPVKLPGCLWTANILLMWWLEVLGKCAVQIQIITLYVLFEICLTLEYTSFLVSQIWFWIARNWQEQQCEKEVRPS